MILIFIACLSSIITAIFKAISDRVASEDLWRKSIFSKYKIDGFLGCKDFTWKRKDSPNKILNYLQHTIFVFYTDIWHFANMIQKISILILFIPYFFLESITPVSTIISLGAYMILSPIIFHLFYHRILLKKDSFDEF